MKKVFIASVLAWLLFWSGMSIAVPENFTIDPAHSYVLWRINHLGFSEQAGKWYVKGDLVLDKDNPQNDKVRATVEVANIITGIKELDEHLLGKQFFDVAQFPKATFESNKVVVTGKDTADIHGILTVHGVSKPIVLKAKFNKAGKSIITDKMTVGFNATTTLKRSDFDIKTFLPQLGDEVKIDISIEAYLNK